jgi:hypothetical protein
MKTQLSTTTDEVKADALTEGIVKQFADTFTS